MVQPMTQDMTTLSKPYRRDMSGEAIRGGSQIVGIINLTVNSTSWITVFAPDTTSFKAFLAKLRSGNPWMLRIAGSSNYITIDESLSLDMAVIQGESMFKVQTASGSDVLEVLLLD